MYVKWHDKIEATPIPYGEGFSQRVLIGPNESPNYGMFASTINAGGCMPKHTNRIEHEGYVLKGRATIKIGDETHEVGPGAAFYIPANVPHSYKVVGDEPFEYLYIVPNIPDEAAFTN